MKYLLKLSFLIYIIVHLVLEVKAGFMEVFIVLLITAVNLLKDRYYDSKYLTFVSLAIILAGTYVERSFAILICITVFDMVYDKLYIVAIASATLLIYFLSADSRLLIFLLVAFMCALTAYVFRDLEMKTVKYKDSLDEERRLRYQLEQAKVRLLNSARETSRLAEISERNRIAREIHDSVGHKIAGILIQLQVALKLQKIDAQNSDAQKSDAQKSEEILEKSVVALSESLTMLRDTVHKLKPKESVGIDYIKEIVENFKFCSVDFKLHGDFNSLAVSHIELLATNIKEALTNASKHSSATEMEIRIDINDKVVRLYIKDNGNGCARVKEGLGLSGMKERIMNIGGSISVSGEDGFMIVCIIPRIKGVNLGEGTYS